MSREHATIRSRGGRFEIVDDGSTNGTDVNGTPIERQGLEHEDEISLGGFLIRFRLTADQPADTE